MIFGRKRRAAQADDRDDLVEEQGLDDLGEDAVAEDDGDLESEPVADAADLDQTDWRADGPFDYDEVELGTDVPRIDLETLILTPWDGLNLQLQVDEQSRRVLAVTGVWESSGLEVALFAASASGGLAAELRAEVAQQVAEAGGQLDVTTGPFGPELRRVLPHTGPKGEELFHVSRVWYAEGPRWLLQGTLLGEAALPDAPESAAAPFVEFFRNLVVQRDAKPMVPGERITMRLPEGAS